MRIKKYLSILTILISLAVKAQMYVSPNTYMYVGNQYVYVAGNVDLNSATSKIYMRRDAQLLQGTAGSSTNKGLGALSVYQEGTVNNFQYNYWCSPVGGSTGVAGNQPFGITQLGVPNVNLDLTSFAANTPTGSVDGTSSNGVLNTSSYWIYKFANSTLYAQWAYVGSASTIGAGQGFTMKGTSGADAIIPYTGAGANRSAIATAKASGNQRYDFRGVPNDGTINVPMLVDTKTLTGNPYPSAIDLQDLLIDNGPTGLDVCDGTALFWEHDKTVNSHLLLSYRGGYGVYNGASNVYTAATYQAPDVLGMPTGGPTGSGNAFERRFSPIGQGFMIRSTSLAGNVPGNFVINNTHRRFVKEAIANNSEFAKMGGTDNSNPSEGENDSRYGYYGDIPNIAGKDYTKISKAPTPQILVNTMLSTGAIRQMALVFMPNAIEGYDPADAITGEGSLPVDVYFPMLNSQFVQNANKFSIDNKYSLGFKNDVESKFIIRVADFVNFNKAKEVFIHDKELNTYHDIKNAQFELTLPAGVNTTRYEITFKNGDKLVTDEANDVAELNVFQNNTNSLLTIKNPLQVDLTSLSLFDVTGKSILTKTNLGKDQTYEFSTSNLSDGVYIVKLITSNNQEITKKVSISKLK